MTCDELASRLGARVIGDGGTQVTHVAPLYRAGPGALSFLSHRRFSSQLRTCSAAAIILKEEHCKDTPAVCIVSENPYLDYAKATALMYPRTSTRTGVHRSAYISSAAVIGENVYIGAGASVEDGASIGDYTEIGAGCRIGANVCIGKYTRLRANVVVEADCHIGEHCLLQAGVVVGSDGFGYANDGESWLHIPQVGRVVIGDHVEIGANTTIDRGALDDTLVEDGVILDNQIQVAHNVVIGEHTAIAGCVGIAGSAKIGKRCTIGGATTVLGHLEIADDVHINAMSLVSSSIETPGKYTSATPVDEAAKWRKNFARFRKLDALARRLSALERKVGTTGDN